MVVLFNLATALWQLRVVCGSLLAPLSLFGSLLSRGSVMVWCFADTGALGLVAHFFKFLLRF